MHGVFIFIFVAPFLLAARNACVSAPLSCLALRIVPMRSFFLSFFLLLGEPESGRDDRGLFSELGQGPTRQGREGCGGGYGGG